MLRVQPRAPLTTLLMRAVHHTLLETGPPTTLYDPFADQFAGYSIGTIFRDTRVQAEQEINSSRAVAI
jgi:O-methyltransferase involved in polyketide biosynthesis